MKFLFILFLSAAFIGDAFAQTTNPVSVNTETEKLFNGMVKAYNEHNLKDYFNYLHDDIVFFAAPDYDKLYRGKQAVG